MSIQTEQYFNIEEIESENQKFLGFFGTGEGSISHCMKGVDDLVWDGEQVAFGFLFHSPPSPFETDNSKIMNTDILNLN